MDWLIGFFMGMVMAKILPLIDIRIRNKDKE